MRIHANVQRVVAAVTIAAPGKVLRAFSALGLVLSLEGIPNFKFWSVRFTCAPCTSRSLRTCKRARRAVRRPTAARAARCASRTKRTADFPPHNASNVGLKQFQWQCFKDGQFGNLLAHPSFDPPTAFALEAHHLPALVERAHQPVQLQLAQSVVEHASHGAGFRNACGKIPYFIQ